MGNYNIYFLVVRGLVGVSLGILQSTTLVMIQESVPKKLVPAACIALTFHSSIGVLVPYAACKLIDIDKSSVIEYIIVLCWPIIFNVLRLSLFIF